MLQAFKIQIEMNKIQDIGSCIYKIKHLEVRKNLSQMQVCIVFFAAN